MTIWINEQIDPCGIIYSCIASQNEKVAQDCHQAWQQGFTEAQLQEGWTANLRTVEFWDDVPVSALKIN